MKPIRLMRIKPDRELKTLRAQYDGPGAFYITIITMTDTHLMIPEAVADVLNEKYLGKVAKRMSDLYQLRFITKDTESEICGRCKVNPTPPPLPEGHPDRVRIVDTFLSQRPQFSTFQEGVRWAEKMSIG